MNAQPPATIDALAWHIEDSRRQMTALRADVRELREAAKFAQRRADAEESRADATEARADRAESLVDRNSHRIDALEADAAIDREMMAQLHAEGVLSQEHTTHLQQALRSSRSIGAAMGIIMATRGLDENGAFAVLSRGSQNTNRKLSAVAEEVVRTRDITGLPDL